MFDPCSFCPSKLSGADAPWCAHFSSAICCVNQEGVISLEKCAHRGASARRECHTLSLGWNKHGHNNSAPNYLPFFKGLCHRMFWCYVGIQVMVYSRLQSHPCTNQSMKETVFTFLQRPTVCMSNGFVAFMVKRLYLKDCVARF